LRVDLPSRPFERSVAHAGARLKFGHIEVDIDAGELRADGRLLDIEPQPRKLLLHLIQNRHRVVSRPELVREVWGCEVSNDALGRAILKARRAINDDKATPALRTVARVGYRFTAPVQGDGSRPADQAERTSVAFLPFENATGDPALAWVQLGLPVLVGQTLSHGAGVSLAAMTSVVGALGGLRGAPLAEQAAAVQRAAGATAVVHARIRRHSRGLRLDYRLFAGQAAESGSVREENAPRLAASLVEALGRHLGVAPGTNVVASLDFPQDPLALEAYVRGRQAQSEQRSAVAINLYRLSLELEPGHTPVALELLSLLARTTTGATVEIPVMAAELLAKARAADDRRTMVNVHLALAHWRACHHEPVASEEEVRRALELSDGSEGSMFWAEIHARLAVAAFGQGRQDDARTHAEQAHTLFEHAGDRVRLMSVMLIESGICITGAEYERAVELTLAVAREARQLSLIRTVGNACNNACMGLIGLGRIDEAIAHAAEGFACGVSVPDRSLMDQLAETAAFACRLAGRPAVAGRVLAELDALPGEPYSEGIVSLARALHHACRGEWQQAVHHARWAFEDARSTRHWRFAAYAFPWYIETLVLNGSLDEAQAQLDVTDTAMLHTSERGVQLFLVRAALEHRRGDRRAALDFLQQALDVEPAPLWRAWACTDAAWLHAEDGRFEEAARLLGGLDGPLARLPLVIATRARVRHASGDVHGAAALHRLYVEAREEPSWHDYFKQLGAAYERRAAGSDEQLPLAPFLPSRIC